MQQPQTESPDRAPALPGRTDQPVFVVGVPRSGTTLLGAMLCAHSRLSCGPETHFFTALRGADCRLLCKARGWPAPALTFLYSIEQGGRPVPENYGLSREEIADYLRRRPPTLTSTLASLTEQYMRRSGKQRWVEKTPNQLTEVRRIRALFPRAPILRIIRDPRDVALSLTRVPWGTSSFLEGLCYWRHFDEASAAFFETDRQGYTLRYEDLVADPEKELRAVCIFLGEQFEPGMLDTRESASHLNRIGESWKCNVGDPLDASRRFSWQKELNDDDVRGADAVVGDRLEQYGYPRPAVQQEHATRFVAGYPWLALGRHPELLANLITRGARFWPTSALERAALRLFVGDPDGDFWLKGGSNRRVLFALRLGFRVLRARMAGEPVYWVREQNGTAESGKCARLLSTLFALGGVVRAAGHGGQVGEVLTAHSDDPVSEQPAPGV